MAVALSHLVRGPANSVDIPTVVLIHGMGARVNRASWNPVVPLLENDFQLVTVDLRGHGDSPAPGSYVICDMADDVAALMDELDIRGAIVIGHSMGGIVALNLALARPDLVSRLVIEDSPPPAPEFSSQFESVIPDNPTTYDLEQRPQILKQLSDPSPPWLPRLAEITIPTLVIGGGESGGIDQVGLAAIADTLPNGEFTTIDVGHNIHDTHPAEFVNAVWNWLD